MSFDFPPSMLFLVNYLLIVLTQVQRCDIEDADLTLFRHMCSNLVQSGADVNVASPCNPPCQLGLSPAPTLMMLCACCISNPYCFFHLFRFSTFVQGSCLSTFKILSISHDLLQCVSQANINVVQSPFFIAL